MIEWNLLDETIKSAPTMPVFKRELVRLVRPSKKSYRLHPNRLRVQLTFPEFHFETEAKVDFPSACI